MDPYWKRLEDAAENKALKAASGVFYFLAALNFIAVVVLIVLMANVKPDPDQALALLIGIPVFLLVGVLEVFVGRAIKQGQRWGRNVGSILAVVGLLGFPLGTLLSVYTLYNISKANRDGAFA